MIVYTQVQRRGALISVGLWGTNEIGLALFPLEKPSKNCCSIHTPSKFLPRDLSSIDNYEWNHQTNPNHNLSQRSRNGGYRERESCIEEEERLGIKALHLKTML